MAWGSRPSAYGSDCTVCSVSRAIHNATSSVGWVAAPARNPTRLSAANDTNFFAGAAWMATVGAMICCERSFSIPGATERNDGDVIEPTIAL